MAEILLTGTRNHAVISQPNRGVRMANDDAGRWLPVKEAAATLGLTENNLRTRLSRRKERSRRGNDGRVYVFVGDDQAVAESTVPAAAPSGNMLPVEAVLEIKETYEQVVRLQRDQARELKESYEARISDLKHIYGDQVQALHQELAATRAENRAELDAVHAKHKELADLVREFLRQIE